jgi:hypothetical protein
MTVHGVSNKALCQKGLFITPARSSIMASKKFETEEGVLIQITRRVIVGEMVLSDDPGKGREAHMEALHFISMDYGPMHWNDKSAGPVHYDYHVGGANYTVSIAATTDES